MSKMFRGTLFILCALRAFAQEYPTYGPYNSKQTPSGHSRWGIDGSCAIQLLTPRQS
jgi:hypothetical protein